MADAYLFAGSAADDAGFVALRDLSEALADEAETGIIGGHMVSLLTASFPSPGFVPRRTNDADGGIPTALAASGQVHERLLDRGYTRVGGNRYRRELGVSEQIVDILVPSLGLRLGTETLGGRQFDSMPGLGVALANRLSIDVHAKLTAGAQLQFTCHVPSVEGAIILKAYAWEGRRSQKDAIDLHSLFRIVETHSGGEIGGWHLDESPPRGARRDTGRILHALARNWEARPPKVAFDYRQLVASIRTRVAPPKP